MASEPRSLAPPFEARGTACDGSGSIRNRQAAQGNARRVSERLRTECIPAPPSRHSCDTVATPFHVVRSSRRPRRQFRSLRDRGARKRPRSKCAGVGFTLVSGTGPPRNELAAYGHRKRVRGDDLLSHRVAPAVPSALAGLTSGFGMEPGVAPPLKSPLDPCFSESTYVVRWMTP